MSEEKQAIEPPEEKARSLFDELRDRRRDFAKVFGPGAIVAFIGFAIAYYFVEPSPPREIVIAAGHKGGSYYAAAEKYAEHFADSGVKLTIRETAGSVENYDLLLHDDDVDVAIVQGGTVPHAALHENAVQHPRLESLASLFLEPVWVFYRSSDEFDRATQLKGKRIAIGKDGSGTQLLARKLLDINGLRDGEGGTKFVEQGGGDVVKLLRVGEIDAALFVQAADSPQVVELLCDPNVRLMSFERNHAYARRFAYLESVVLEQGVVNFGENLPKQSVRLIAPAANLVATAKLHDAFIPLLLDAATSVHEKGGLLNADGHQPSLNHVEFQINPVARDYMKHGPSFFQKHLSFWAASLIDRAKIMIVPLLILLIPLAKVGPPVYRWRIRSRIYRWYAILRQIDQSLRSTGEDVCLADCKRKLEAMESELVQVNVPLSYMEEFYNLRLHINLVKRRTEAKGVRDVLVD